MRDSGTARIVDAMLEASVVLSFARIGATIRSRLAGWSETRVADGHRPRVLITGADCGLGTATAAALVRAGADVLATTRTRAMGSEAASRLRADLGVELAARVERDTLELAELADVRGFARRHAGEPLDAIVHNGAAVFATFGRTADGLERTYQLHVVAPFLLTTELLGQLASSAHGRVVTVTSAGLYRARLDVDALTDPRIGYRPKAVYAQARRAQLTLVGEWARRMPGIGVTFSAVHPGWVAAPRPDGPLPRSARALSAALRTPGQGVDTTVRLATTEHVPRPDGGLWHDRRRRGAHRVPWTRPPRGEAGELWARVCRDAGVHPQPPPTPGTSTPRS